MADELLLSTRFTVAVENSGAARRGGERLPVSEVVLPDVVAERGTAGQGKPSYTPLVLRRAVAGERSFGQWMKRGQALDLLVSLLDGGGRPAVQWRAKGAVPLRWSHSPLNAKGGNEVAMESIELAVAEFERVE